MDILEAIRWLEMMINENKRAAQSFPESNASKRAEAIEAVLNALDNSISKDKIREKIEEYLQFDRENKTYTKDGRENFSMQYFYARALEELLKEE